MVATIAPLPAAHLSGGGSERNQGLSCQLMAAMILWP
jgi:hypothetical protein